MPPVFQGHHGTNEFNNGGNIPLGEFKGYFATGGMSWVGYGKDGVKLAKERWKAVQEAD